MRPSLLNPLFAAVTTLPGIGPRAGEALSPPARPRTGAARHRPPVPPADRRDRPPGAAEAARRGARYRRHRRGHRRPPPAAAAQPAARALSGLHQRRDRRSHPHLFQRATRITCRGSCRSAQRRYVSGTVALYDHMLQMVHPDRVVAEADLAKLPLVEPVYPLTEGLGLNQVRKAVDAALARVPELPEWQEPSWRRARALSAFRRGAAQPAPAGASRPMSLPEGPAWSRLAYDEFLAGQLALALVRAHVRRPAGRATPGTGTSAQETDRGPALFAHALADARRRRDRRRPRQARAHAATAAGRCGLGQDRGGVARGRDRDRRRPPGRADGADRDPGAAAFQHHRAARRRRRHQCRHPDRPRARTRAQRHAREARLRRDPRSRRHPRAVPGGGRVSRPRARGGRRAASFRRAPAPRARHRRARRSTCW